jgi:hypothetical protein
MCYEYIMWGKTRGSSVGEAASSVKAPKGLSTMSISEGVIVIGVVFFLIHALGQQVVVLEQTIHISPFDSLISAHEPQENEPFAEGSARDDYPQYLKPSITGLPLRVASELFRYRDIESEYLSDCCRRLERPPRASRSA